MKRSSISKWGLKRYAGASIRTLRTGCRGWNGKLRCGWTVVDKFNSERDISLSWILIIRDLTCSDTWWTSSWTLDEQFATFASVTMTSNTVILSTKNFAGSDSFSINRLYKPKDKVRVKRKKGQVRTKVAEPRQGGEAFSPIKKHRRVKQWWRDHETVPDQSYFPISHILQECKTRSNLISLVVSNLNMGL